MQLRIKIKILLLPVKYFINIIKISIFDKCVLVISQKQHYFVFKVKDICLKLFLHVSVCRPFYQQSLPVLTGSIYSSVFSLF